MPWIEVPFKGGPLSLASARKTLAHWLADHPIDIIHSHYRRPESQFARKLRADWQFPVPILYTIHLSTLKLRWPWRMFSDFGDHVHVAVNTEAKRCG